MLGTSCKKIVLQLALQDIGQLTDFGSTAYTLEVSDWNST